ncbi:tail fiber domain-containing protein [Winogradskyella forsetii]|uniref:tail fiber domain-containing protein n=1 Tax=Winogradskyella forsetii TaxID=2686077 RepID=UPI0015BB1143|nr:tail fiber domain-containing protein [Winogradskyella forsetii]
MKNHKIIIVLIVLCTQSVISQVGIGNTSPNATLDISSSNQATPNNTDGILIPKVDEFPTTNPTALQDGMLVYATGNGTPTKGFYYWDISGTSWINATGAKRINDLMDGKSDNDGTNDGSSLFLGINAGSNDDETDNRNIGIGFGALSANINGIRNTVLGYNALNLNTTGTRNTAIGYMTLNSNEDGNGNTSIGYSVLENNVSGTSNSGLGFWALQNNVSGNDNTAVGNNALRNTNTGFSNSALGIMAGVGVSGNFNTFIGANSGLQTTVQNIDGSVMIGYAAGQNEFNSNRLYIENSDANTNNALIYGEFDNNILRTNSEFQIGNPTVTGYAFPTVDGTVNQILQTDGSGSLNWIDPSAIVTHRINDLIDGKSDLGGANEGASIFLGVDAGLNDDGGNYNVGVGYESVNGNTTGFSNVAVGVQSLYSNTNGNFNTAIGLSSLRENISGSLNTGLGISSLYSNITGSRNIGLGGYSLSSNISGNLNLALGGQSLENNETGYGNIAIGFQSGSQMPDLNNNITIGYQSGFNETESDRLYIENSNADANNALIYGEFDNNILGFNANLGIGTIAPVTRLHIVEEGIADTQTIVAGLASNTSNRPVLQFSETANMGLAEGMSIEYNGVGLAGDNRMVINGLGGNPLIQFRNNGNLNVLNGSVGVQTEFPTCAMEINHPTGSGIEGLKLSNQVDTDNWRFYVQWNTNTLALMYNNVNVGNFDDVSGVYTAISDKNQKTNISSVASVLEKIQTLQVVDYNFKFQKDSKKYVGLIAQDVEAVFPHLVNPPNEESPNYTMDYSGFGVLAIKAIQEQQAEIKELKQQLQWQQKEIDKIKSILKEVITD